MSNPCKIVGCDQPIRYVNLALCNRHYLRLRRNGDPLITRRNLNGEGSITSQGYREHCINRERKADHVAIAERALGRPLPPGAEPHHVNGNKLDNRNENLVLCPNRAYHMLLHRRTRALKACGNADWRKCTYCKHWDTPKNLYTTDRFACHRKCAADRQRRRRANTGHISD